MKLTAENVEEIVRSVLRELQPVPAAISAAASPAVVSAAISDDVIRLSSLVVSEAVLSAAGAAGRTVSLMRGAVLTPSGRDYLRRHGVCVASQFSDAAAGGTAVAKAAGGLVIQVQRTAVLESAAGSAGWVVETVGGEDVAIDRILQLHGGQPLVCVGADPAVSACLLNRRVDVRAAAVTGSSDLQRLIERMRPTVLCMEAAGWSWTQLVRALRTMSVAVRSVPPGWHEVQQGAGR